MRHISFLVLCLLFVNFTSAQTEEEFEANYAIRIQQEMIDGVYIPYDLDDAHAELSRLTDKKGLVKFKSAPEDTIRRKLHFGFGRWIMTNWGLEDGSRISHHLRQRGVTREDDMIRLIIVTWHRKLNGKPLRVEEEIAAIRSRVEKEKDKIRSKQKVTVIETRPHKD